MTATYEKIATNTLGSNATSYTFSSIPATYTDLVIIANVLSADATSKYLTIQYNSDTGTNYSDTLIAGTGTAVESARDTTQSQIYITAYGSMLTNTSNPMLAIINIQNYANTTTYKTAISRANQASSTIMASVSLWRSTAAINAVKLIATAGNFASGSTFTLYGIKAE
jgi:hypothetical protein